MVDDDEYISKVNFVKNRIIELENKKISLIKKGLETSKVDKQIKFNKALLLTMDEGQEYYQLEN